MNRLMSLGLRKREKRRARKEVGEWGFGVKKREEKYNVTLSGPGVGCEGIKGTFEEPEDDSESARRVVSMITRSRKIF